MSVIVSLWSRKAGEIKRFLEKYYVKELCMDEDVEQWIYVFKRPLDAVDIMSALIDNNDKYDIALCIQVDEGDVCPVTCDNHNDIVKALFHVYYNENSGATY